MFFDCRPQAPSRHCRRCPGAPLRSQCVHTKAGRSYLDTVPPSNTHFDGLNEEDNSSYSALINSENGTQLCLAHPENSNFLNGTPAMPGNNLSSTPQNFPQPSGSVIQPAHSFSFAIGSQSKGPSRNNIPAGTLINGEQVDQVSESIQAPSFAIDPQLELKGQSYSNTPTRASVNGEQVGEGSASTQSKSSKVDDRVRPTTYNPLYGFVEGAKRGNMDWNVLRTKTLRVAETDSKKAAACFS
ncbi:hypothetical protein PILCRDRAFT_751805 [Piloderma croceum F 1598]|uniref:Uncharacterized protein n=1 Tax=Piloderma croceum (strain F 1598) TaxID=765440 RepID=A0A0C3EUC6_PILCF|nr:hypothetical protein PILCRDRAFT_751805 [Piloderma croceum F 1598]